jgi:hypothetical protein
MGSARYSAADPICWPNLHFSTGCLRWERKRLLAGVRPNNPFRATSFSSLNYEQPMLLPQLWHR